MPDLFFKNPNLFKLMEKYFERVLEFQTIISQKRKLRNGLWRKSKTVCDFYTHNRLVSHCSFLVIISQNENCAQSPIALGH